MPLSSFGIHVILAVALRSVEDVHLVPNPKFVANAALVHVGTASDHAVQLEGTGFHRFLELRHPPGWQEVQGQETELPGIVIEIGPFVVSLRPLAKKIKVRVMLLSILDILQDFKEKVFPVSQPGIVSTPVYGTWLGSQRTSAFQLSKQGNQTTMKMQKVQEIPLQEQDAISKTASSPQSDPVYQQTRKCDQHDTSRLAA